MATKSSACSPSFRGFVKACAPLLSCRQKNIRSMSMFSSATQPRDQVWYPLLIKWRKIVLERIVVRHGLPAEIVDFVLTYLDPDPRFLLFGNDDSSRLPQWRNVVNSTLCKNVSVLAVEASINLLVCSFKDDTSTYLWNLDEAFRPNMSPILCFRGLFAEVTCVSLSKNQRHLAGAADGSLRLWDTITGATIATMTLYIWPQYTFVSMGHTCAISALAMMPLDIDSNEDSCLLLGSGGLDGTLCVWNAQGTCKLCVDCVEVCKDSSSLASEPGCGVSAVAWSRDGVIVLAAVGWNVLGYFGKPPPGRWPTPVLRLSLTPGMHCTSNPIAALHVRDSGEVLGTDSSGFIACWTIEATSLAQERPLSAACSKRPVWWSRGDRGPKRQMFLGNNDGLEWWRGANGEVRWLQDGLIFRGRLPGDVRGLVPLGLMSNRI
eukprot:TRINITY_DN16050_c1_g1_i1.p1 TRINITY_DN16050_c1_g1~~TRINITY_DN16050_c1_g1_i1.p1  ORF type:complete len:434 (+),score=19.92 TRINITY_DN16050_c1_g1_i1:49-1350(+)